MAGPRAVTRPPPPRLVRSSPPSSVNDSGPRFDTTTTGRSVTGTRYPQRVEGPEAAGPPAGPPPGAPSYVPRMPTPPAPFDVTDGRFYDDPWDTYRWLRDHD